MSKLGELTKVRILVLAHVCVLIISALAVHFYDLRFPQVVQAYQLLNQSNLTTGLGLVLFLGCLEMILLIYASIALWIGHFTGKWAFLAYVICGCIDTLQVKFVALSSLSLMLTNISIIFSGMILMVAFSLKPEIK